MTLPSTRRRSLALVAALAWSCGASLPALAQKAPVLEIPNFDRIPAFYRVADVEPGGTVRIQLGDQARSVPIGFHEGYYLLAVRPDGGAEGARLIRGQVTEIVDGPTALVTVGREAAAALHRGDPVVMVRPLSATTAQLRDLPAIVPIGPDPATDPGDEPSAEFQREARARARSLNNLRQIGLALRNFHSANDQFPPALVRGPDGKPWHSWRVLLLPYLEQTPLLNQYDFSQPWDSPKNRKLLDRMPDVYRDPVHGDTKGHFTHYAVLTGAGKARSGADTTPFPASGQTMKDARTLALGPDVPGASGFRDVTDGNSNTIAVVPVGPDRKIPWTKPEDIAFGRDFPGLGKPGGIAAPYRTGAKLDGPRAAPVLMFDGSVRVLLDTISVETLRSLSTSAGGELIRDDKVPTLPIARPEPGPKVLRISNEGGKARAWLAPLAESQPVAPSAGRPR